MSGNTALKFDNEKIRVDLLPVRAMTEIGKVLTFGANKYAENNWRKGFKWSRLIGAALRHLFAFMRGEDRDPESGLLHLAHLGCCVVFLLDHQLLNLGEDDRYHEDSKPKPERVRLTPKEQKEYGDLIYREAIGCNMSPFELGRITELREKDDACRN
jgi:hypothetical protein